MLKKLLLIVFALACLSASAWADDPPAWLRQAAGSTLPQYGKDVAAVVLYQESRRTYEDDGRVKTVDSYAVRILNADGRAAAHAVASYSTDSEKVKDMRAWLLRPTGEVKSYGKKETSDFALAKNDVYNEVRARLLNAEDDAVPGSVFGYEITTEEKTVFTQFTHQFQRLLPVLLSRVSVTLPQGWRAESVTFNRDKLEPVVNGTTYVWELRNLPYLEAEPAQPEFTNLIPRLAVSVYPPAGKSAPVRTFASWQDVSRYTIELSDPQTAYTPEMEAKARELTANAKTEFERIQAIARYAQSVNYISIQIGLGRGGGYRPHAAAEVFSKNYGDCKDKANLMRALLKALKIESYPVIIYSGDPTYVRPEWPSPHQFNHYIIAIKVSEDTIAPTVINHPAAGRLLIFDPTDDDTPFGYLPDHEQGSYALVAVGDVGDLLKMPVTLPEANRLERTVEAELSADGQLTAKVSERSFGQAAVDERRMFKRVAKPQYLKTLERWITQTAPSANVLKAEPLDDALAGKFALDVEFKSPSYGQVMQGRLLVFKPAVVSRRSSVFLTDTKRKHPVVLESEAYSETVKIKLPPGFEVDEFPEATELNQSFGNYAAVCEVKDGHLLFKRTLVLKSATIPVEQYTAVRSFFERIRAVEQAPVVLLKK